MFRGPGAETCALKKQTRNGRVLTKRMAEIRQKLVWTCGFLRISADFYAAYAQAYARQRRHADLAGYRQSESNAKYAKRIGS